MADEYKIDRIKPVSNRRRWEYWREKGIITSVEDNGAVNVYSKQELDDYTDRAIWLADHPGQDPTTIVKARGEYCPDCAQLIGYCGKHQEPSDGVPSE